MPNFNKPHCLYVDETMKDPETGRFIPSMIFENEPGHYPMKGDPSKHQAPWYVGSTIETAEETVKEINAEKYGVDEDQALNILISSMKASG